MSHTSLVYHKNFMMSSLIPYTIGGLARRSIVTPLTNPTVRKVLFDTGGKIANLAMRTAARKIARAWKKRRGGRVGYRTAKRRKISRTKKGNIGTQARRKMGDHVHSSNAKRTTIANQDPIDRDTRTLYMNSLLTCSLGQGIDERERSIINCRGIKLFHRFVNTQTYEVTVNIAVITSKFSNIDPPFADGFFRGYGPTRGQDFDPTTMSGLNFHYGSINTDRYLVHWHKRFTLSAVNNLPASNIYSHAKTLKKYVKIQRQIRYTDKLDPGDGTTEPINTNLYLVWWCDRKSAGTGDEVALNAIQHTANSIMYFRETSAY